MSFKVVKVVAVPVVLGLASIRVYTVSEAKTEHLLSPGELMIYSTEPKGGLHYVEEHPGILQRGLGKVRGGLQSYIQNVQSAFVSAKVTAVNVYHAGEDIYHFLKDPPSGFVPRVAVITVSGLAGVILARKGSRLKRLGLPLSLMTAGFAVCYPVQTISTLKVSGKNVYALSKWTSSTISSLWKSPAAFPPNSESASSSTTRTKPMEKTDVAGMEECSQEVPPPTEPSSSPMPEAQTAPVLTQASETDHISPAAEDNPVAMADKGKTSPSFDDSSSETSSLQSSSGTETSTAEKQNHGANLALMDFGQSNPEDADLYSTRS